MKKGKKKVLSVIAIILAVVLCALLWNQFVYFEGNYKPAANAHVR